MVPSVNVSIQITTLLLQGTTFKCELRDSIIICHRNSLLSLARGRAKFYSCLIVALLVESPLRDRFMQQFDYTYLKQLWSDQFAAWMEYSGLFVILLHLVLSAKSVANF